MVFLRAKREASNNLSYTDISNAKLVQISQDTERFKGRESNFKMDMSKNDDLQKKHKDILAEIKQLSQELVKHEKSFAIKKYSCDIIDAIDKPEKLASLFEDLGQELGKENTQEFKSQLELQKSAIERMSSIQLNEFKAAVGNQLANATKIDLDLAIAKRSGSD